MATACYDFICKCGGKVAWIGQPDEMPPCKRCGNTADAADIEALKDLMATVKRITSMDAHFDSGVALRDARKFAGLTLGQAANFLKLSREQLSRIEQDIEKVTPEIADEMNALYGLRKQ